MVFALKIRFVLIEVSVAMVVFQEMVAILKQELLRPKQRGGQPKLSVEDQLLIALEYWREYRIYFHIGQSWRIYESTVCRIVHRVEDKLIKSRKFSLPGKKALLSTDFDGKRI